MTVDWRAVWRFVWPIVREGLVAMLVALLVAMGYSDRLAREALAREQARVGAMGVTHLSALAVMDDVSVGGDLSVQGATSLAELSATNATTLTNLTASGAATLGSLAVSGAGSVGTWLQTLPAETLTIAAGGVITPTGTFQALRATGAVTTSATTAIVDHTLTGTLLCLLNTGEYDIVVKDGANTQQAGDVALGPVDACLYVWDGTQWVMLGKSDN